MPDDLIERIDTAAAEEKITRTEWIRNACTDQLTPAAPGPTPEEHRELMAEVQAVTIRATYQEQTIADLRADREYLRGEIARVQQENSALVLRLLPPPRPGALSRFKRWLSGEPEK